MSKKDRNLTVVIAYNVINQELDGDRTDKISEAAVEEEVRDVYAAVSSLGYDAKLLPVRDIMSDLSSLTSSKPDVIFNLCEGYDGDAGHEMHVAGLWELLGMPYTGNIPLTLGLAQNKVLTKKLLESKKIPTPMYQVYSKPPKNVYLDFPVIVKPVREDASLGITQASVVDNFSQLKDQVTELLEKYQQPILAEKYIEGREFNIGILGNSPAKVLPVSEIDFSQLSGNQRRITSYEAKWLTDHPVYHKTPARCPAMIDCELRNRLQDVAIQVFHLLHGRDYARVDVRMDESEKIFILEFNPNPDISQNAGYANALRAAGMSYPDFIDHLINQAMNR